jgi:hypothetical protein
MQSSLSLMRVKNTFIEAGPFEDEDTLGLYHDDMGYDFSKRQVSEPAPSTGKLLEQSSMKSYFSQNVIPEEGRSPTLESLPEPEKESDPTPYDQDTRQSTMMQQAGYPAQTPEVGASWVIMPAPASSNPSNASMQMAVAALLSSSSNQMETSQHPPQAWSNVLTVMMRNLPNKVCQSMLLSEVNAAGFQGAYDFLYLPIDPDTEANRGYAFINFVTPGHAFMFKMRFEGNKFGNFNSHKVVSVVPATLQGFDANYAHYSKTRITQGDPACRPLFLREPLITKSQRGGRNKTQSLIDLAAKQLRKQQHQLAEGRQRDFAGKRITGAERSSAPADSGSKPSVAKFCPYCGGSIGMHFKFCQYCGQNVAFGADDLYED